jgi:ApbE superfamily uncharacterized protein (UPF0280 family)
MKPHENRTYRKGIKSEGLVSFNIIIKETDLWVSCDRDLKTEATDLVFEYRYQLESYIKSHPEFLTTLKPYPEDPYAPAIVKEMILSTRDLGVGPMASVAGAIAQYVGLKLLESADQVIVENGGDIFLKLKRRATVSMFAGDSPLSEKIGLSIPTRLMPLGICSSSGEIGHSLSMGSADLICLLSQSTVLADGAATALGNKIRSKKDMDRLPEYARNIDGILGGIGIMGDVMTTWGDVELINL